MSILRGVAALTAACRLAHILMKPLWELAVRMPLSVSLLGFVFLSHTDTSTHRHIRLLFYLGGQICHGACVKVRTCEGQ